MNILLVSPIESDIRWIRTILSEMGIKDIDVCANSTDAVQFLGVNKYNIVITEAFLPVLSGFDLKKLMNSFGFNIPVLLFTDKVSESTKKEAKYAGIIDCFSTDNLDSELPIVLEKVGGISAF